MKENSLSKAPVNDSQYYYQQLPEGVRQKMTYEQEREIRKVIQRAIRVPSKKLICVELTFSFFKRFYMVWYLGRDLRHGPRLETTNKQNFMRIALHFFCTSVLWISLSLSAALLLYEMKTFFDIDLVPRQHADQLILDALRSTE